MTSLRITSDQIDAFRRDGIVCLRGIFSPAWVDELRALVEEDIQNPSGMVKNINAEGATGFFFGDTFVCHHNAGFKRAVFNSPAAGVMAGLFGARKVNLLFDQILVKEPGSTTRTMWHHDHTYWPVAGDQVCTLWIALDPVTAENGAVEYIRGSHKWGQRFKAQSFTGDDRYKEDLPEMPDIDSMRDQLDVLQFEMAPGDCTIHHGLLVHGAPGNETGGRRRAYVARWCGDDVTYNPRPNIQQMLRDPDIAPGGPLDCDLFPVVWPRPA